MRDDIKTLWAEIYKSDQYKEFKRDVRKRDNYTCQKCNSRGTVNRKNRLHVHHILPKCKFPAAMFIPTNGIVLCNKCHIQEHKDMLMDGRDFRDKPSATQEELLHLITTLTFTVYNSYIKRRNKKRRKYNIKPRSRKR